MTINDDDMIYYASRGRAHAHAPYSRFSVGAALLCAAGKVYNGCNVENVSLGLTMCAERVAVGTAVTDGVKDFSMLAIVSDSREPIVPCGACRQVLAEFNPTLRIISATLAGERMECRLDELLPKPGQGILDCST